MVLGAYSWLPSGRLFMVSMIEPGLATFKAKALSAVLSLRSLNSPSKKINRTRIENRQSVTEALWVEPCVGRNKTVCSQGEGERRARLPQSPHMRCYSCGVQGVSEISSEQRGLFPALISWSETGILSLKPGFLGIRWSLATCKGPLSVVWVIGKWREIWRIVGKAARQALGESAGRTQVYSGAWN